MLLNNSRKAIYLLGSVCFIFFLTGCNSNDKMIENNYYLSLSGESENWKVNTYEIIIKPDMFKVGDAKLTMKNKTEYSTTSFNIRVHAVIGNQDMVVQGKTVTGSETDITQTTSGATKSGAYFNKSGEPISIKDISDVYMIIEWQDENKRMKEKVDLFNQEEIFETKD
ncbi:hypothetical protein VBD025_17085 [Virgibacillus flavescens]|uniref:hypothetical protein n=1 Tax=Virgibacillus flavescens TaxID=1611422 RepID=UPI003D34AB56